MTPEKLLARLIETIHETGIVSEHDGSLWVGSVHWVVRLGSKTRKQFDALWNACNLDLEPMVFDVGPAIEQRVSGIVPVKPQDIGRLIPQDQGAMLDPRPVADGRVVLRRDSEPDVECWQRADTKEFVAFNTYYAGAVREFVSVANWHLAKPFGPAVGYSSGKPCALFMPVRTGALFLAGVKDV